MNSETNSAANPLAHHELIVDQFNRQSATFAQRHAQTDPLERMLRMTAATPVDTVLDVGCGPGIVACALAAVAHHVTGLDLSPAMVEQARARQAKQSLVNMSWLCGDVAQMPFEDESFSIVVSRYAFHHFLSPAEVLAEMKRVCRAGGRVIVADVTPAAEKLRTYDEFETLRDPSHTHALSLHDLRHLFAQAGLVNIETASFGLQMDFEDLMAGSFPNPESVECIWQLLLDDLGKDRIGLRAERKGGKYTVTFPTTILAATKAAAKENNE